MRIIFMGTPAFATGILSRLLADGHDIAAVVTAPDKFGGRGKQQLLQSEVKQFATGHSLPLWQPEKLRDPQFIEDMTALQADLAVIVAFRMLPETVWRIPRLGTINLHASLLPDYRGAAPINWAIINGETETGVTTFFIDSKIDTGDILLKKSTAIGPEETAGELQEKLMHLGADLVSETVSRLRLGDLHAQAQATGSGKEAPKIFKEHGAIVPLRSSAEIHNLIRGLSPSPGAYTRWQEKEVKILRSRISTAQLRPEAVPGSLYRMGKKLVLACGDGPLELLEVQMEGKKKMDAASFLNGHRQYLADY